MDYFPVFFDLQHKPVLVFGNGEDALRKVRLLLRTSARVYVCGETGPAWPESILTQITFVGDNSERLDELSDVAFVIIAEDQIIRRNAALNWSRKYGKSVNVVDQKGLSDFIIPSLIDRGKFVAAFTSSGAAPVLARTIRADLERLIPEKAEAIFAQAAGVRAAVAIRYTDPSDRRLYWERLAERLFGSNEVMSDNTLQDIFINAFKNEAGETDRDIVWITLPHPLRADDITLGDYRSLQACDVLVMDRPLPEEISDLVRRDAVRIEVTPPISKDLLMKELSDYPSLKRVVVLIHPE